MKTKVYYIAIALLWLSSGCTSPVPIAMGELTGVYTYTHENHTYIASGQGLAHSGSCKQCKLELDSIVKNAVNEAFEKYGRESWNE